MELAEIINLGITVVAIIVAVVLFVAFRKNVAVFKIGNNEIRMKDGGPVLDPDATKLYTREIIKLSHHIGDLERRVMLFEMMKHGEEGITVFCNKIRSDFREFLYTKADTFTPLLMDEYSHENELVVNQIQREMHGWVLLAMRQNNIPLDGPELDAYCNGKFDLWDGQTDQIRRMFGRTKAVHDEFLIYCRDKDPAYKAIIQSAFKKASHAEEQIKKMINCSVKDRADLEDHFVATGTVKVINGCPDDQNA